jgi:hypothetical protein
MSVRGVGSLTVVAGLALAPTLSGAQTPELATEAQVVIETLRSEGVTDSRQLFAALESAWVADRVEEYVKLRRLDITPTDAEFDRAWQNQTGRAAQFAPYDIEEWATDVLRSWAKVHPRAAFTWLYAVRERFCFELPRRQAFERVTTDWARTSAEAGRESEAEVLAIRDPVLRETAVIGVIRGHILRRDPRRVAALMEHVTDDGRRREIQALYDAYSR